ncbi:hypothetical protein V5799_013330 [Amblyomma americanum]|uniref:Cuticle protein n=1 Tax=Amblyomma americanum TaxID=6943 RepID=A0AAQ4E677_AMBAM
MFCDSKLYLAVLAKMRLLKITRWSSKCSQSRPVSPAPAVGGSIVGGRPAVRTFVQRVPIVSKVGTPAVIPGASHEPVYPPHPYKFGYESVDEFGNTQFRHETSDAQNTKRGSYGYTDVYGISRRVDYVADANGFRARIRTNEPGTAPSAPAGAVYDAKPVAVNPAVIKAQRGGVLVKAGVQAGGSAVAGGAATYVSSHGQHPAAAAPGIAFLGGMGGGHRAVFAQPPVAVGDTVPPVHGPPAGVIHGAGPVVVGHPTLVGGGPAPEVVATKVLTAPGAADASGPHATVGVIALQPHHHHQAAGLDYKAKSR